MAEEQRDRLREMRLSAAARGVRVPDPSVPPLNCAWLDAVGARDEPGYMKEMEPAVQLASDMNRGAAGTRRHSTVSWRATRRRMAQLFEPEPLSASHTAWLA